MMLGNVKRFFPSPSGKKTLSNFPVILGKDSCKFPSDLGKNYCLQYYSEMIDYQMQLTECKTVPEAPNKTF